MASNTASKTFFSDTNKWFVIGFFLLLVYFFSTTTWFVLTSFESLIVSNADRLAAYIYQRSVQGAGNGDKSKIVLGAYDSVDVMLKKGSKRVGYGEGNIRFEQLEGVEIEESKRIKEISGEITAHSIVFREIVISEPGIGKYEVEIYSEKGAVGELVVLLTGRSGVYTRSLGERIDIKPGEKQVYSLRFHKDLVGRSYLRRKWLPVDMVELGFFGGWVLVLGIGGGIWMTRRRS